MDFNKFKTAVAKQFQAMTKHQLFRVDVSGDDLWDRYLAAFPEGTNPIYLERTKHDCNCCKQFIRAVGNVVAIIGGTKVSIWNCGVGDPAYKVVADAMADLVESKPIANIFLHTERTAGTDKNFQDTIDGVKTWEHFFVNIPAANVCHAADLGTKLGDARTTYEMLKRALSEITFEAIDTVLELIDQNSIYRGAEHKFAVQEYQKVYYMPLGDEGVWAISRTLPTSVSRIRNTVIGTLLTDLSEGVPLDAAVRSFEAKVAPANYKRPTALVTKAMIEKAKKQIEDLGLVSALERRYANIDDITINNVLFANRDAKRKMNTDVFDDLAAGVKEKPNLTKVEEVTIEKFIDDILPKATSVEMLFEGRHTGNLVSLVAPADPTAAQLFKWSNGFSWSYAGDVADSIKERVKQAGGNVDGDLCCRLSWSNFDDLDLHMVEPGGQHICYTNSVSCTGGWLDVDMNAGRGTTRTPVENIFYRSKAKMREGTYRLYVNNYQKREDKDVGFDVEMDFMGAVYHFAYDKAVKQGENVPVVTFNFSHEKGIEITNSLPSTQPNREVWGISTNTYQKVNVVMLSPNHWDDQGVGNKHYFFMLDGCRNDATARGFYNEFLKADLDQHRKVLELVGTKMRTEGTERQLSGLGFSSTQRADILCRVSGSFNRIIKITF